MTARRPLTEGIKPVDRTVEDAFVFSARGPDPAAPAPAQTAPTPRGPVERLPVSSRLRADLAVALKRASLERQLRNEYPNSLQEILEEAVEPWLRTRGYLT
ncbi:MAG: hypothetical protein K2V38_21755 [Gemmataceae bacterium]|nr:hypothetical protein [Gemmataceae bacterium]